MTLALKREALEARAKELLAAPLYGLTASIWTKDLKQALKTAMSVEAGYVWINGVSKHFTGTPFGGYKGSGVGREECLEELLGYTQTKAVHVFL